MLVEEMLSKTIGDDFSIAADVAKANDFASTIVYSQVPLILVKGMAGMYEADQGNLKKDGISDDDSSVKGLLLSKKILRILFHMLILRLLFLQLNQKLKIM